MRKVLKFYIYGALIVVFSSFDVILAQPVMPINAYKTWQVKGYAKGAFRMGDYQQAATFFSEWHTRDCENTKVAYLLGFCFEKNRSFILASNLYDSLYNASPRTNIYALYRRGLVNKYLGYFEEAKNDFTQASKQLRRLKSQNVSKKAIKQQIEGCNLAIRWRDTISNMGIERLNESINQIYKETGSIILNDSQFVYGSTLVDLSEQNAVGTSYRPINKVFLANYDSAVWNGGHTPPRPFNGMASYDWAKGTYSLDKKRFYSSYCKPNLRGQMQCKIYVSEDSCSNCSKWSNPVVLGKTVNHRKYSSSQPSVGSCYNDELEVIYFSSNRPGGAGKRDIWFTVYNKATKTYSKSQNAGVFINTSSDEMSPFYDVTSKQLYFSSDGWTGIGGLDIFKSKGDMVVWEEPDNLGLPINSSMDDVDYTHADSHKFGFVASNRPSADFGIDQTCCDDLFIFSESVNTRVKITGQILKYNKAKSFEHLLNNKVDSSIIAAESSVIANTNIILYTINNSPKPLFLKQATTDGTGRFSFWVERGANFKMIVKDTSLLNASFYFNTKEATKFRLLDLKIEPFPLDLRPINNFEIPHINYDLGSSVLSVKAFAVIDTTVLVLMNRFPNITIEIASYTDEKDSEPYNVRLSEKRAAAIVGYLIKKGISPERLQSKGYAISRQVESSNVRQGSVDKVIEPVNCKTEFKIVGVLSE